MKSSVKQFLVRFRTEGRRRATTVTTRAMGRRRSFTAYDLGEDTFVFEKGVWTDLDALGGFAEDLIAKEDIRLGRFHHRHDEEEEGRSEEHTSELQSRI